MSDMFPPAPVTLSLFDDRPRPIVRVIDTETAGQKLSEDAVIEIGSVDIDLATGETGNAMRSFCDPAGAVINPHARKVHRISDAMLAGAPPFAEALKPFAGAPIYAAQRAEFDRSRLRLTGRWLCTYKLALRAFPTLPAHGLQSLIKYVPLDLSPVGSLLAGEHPHRALYDAACTAMLLRAITAKLLPRCADLSDFLERAEKVSLDPALLARFRVGRYKGVELARVPDAYLERLLCEPGMDADTLFTARHHLRNRGIRGTRSLPTAATG